MAEVHTLVRHEWELCGSLEMGTRTAYISRCKTCHQMKLNWPEEQ